MNDEMQTSIELLRGVDDVADGAVVVGIINLSLS
jgi:hypothetical protein